MRIAVASEGLNVASSFERCASFTCYSTRRGVIVDCQNMPNLGFTPTKLVALLDELQVQTLITGTVEPEIAAVLKHNNIEVITHATGSARDAAEDYLFSVLIASDDECVSDEDAQVNSFIFEA